MEPKERRAPATAGPAVASELGEPAPPAEPLDEGGLVGQQLGFYQALAEQDGRAATWYLGARMTLSTTNNPERLQQAAHSLRELMDKLHPIVGLPAKAEGSDLDKSEGGNLGDRFDAMTAKWEKAKQQSKCHTEGMWSGEIDDAARRGLAAVDETIEWQRKNRPRRKETYRAKIRALDVSRRPPPSWIEDTHVLLWDKLRDYFVKVCHHGHETNEDEFSAKLHELERFVLERLKPRTYPEQATLDQLIAEAERGT
jgi:hypothetical protein